MGTLKEMKELVKEGKVNFCCVEEPLLNIELNHVIVDELHLLLRVMDVMLENIITDANVWYKADDFEKASSQPKGLHLQKVVRETWSRACCLGNKKSC